ncbi:hypothetical protein CPB84DRAFT_1748851 [Gymnopilus junonius]|uniref:Uncharacterized protein n=1 Tax=Gymnopilus junonius TaxID=109634 RepID=A0A9P5TL77_GYMJU|nr:hypothetical protein CPB84DRAFT_1748851 [Gymnopilus junonius]
MHHRWICFAVLPRLLASAALQDTMATASNTIPSQPLRPLSRYPKPAAWGFLLDDNHVASLLKEQYDAICSGPEDISIQSSKYMMSLVPRTDPADDKLIPSADKIEKLKKMLARMASMENRAVVGSTGGLHMNGRPTSISYVNLPYNNWKKIARANNVNRSIYKIEMTYQVLMLPLTTGDPFGDETSQFVRWCSHTRIEEHMKYCVEVNFCMKYMKRAEEYETQYLRNAQKPYPGQSTNSSDMARERCQHVVGYIQKWLTFFKGE